MNNEIEVKILDIDKEAVRAKLKEIGARLVKPEVLMRRVVFSTGEDSFVRVRDEGGGKIVMTYKRICDGSSMTGTKEVNVVIDDYERGVLLMRECGLKEKSEEESLRETWVFDAEDGEVEICIDTWPWIPEFLEVEGPSEDSVWQVVELLGFQKEQAKLGSVDMVYQHHYGVDIEVVRYKTPKILFEGKRPEWAS